MANPGINSTAGPDARPTPEPLPDFTPQSQQPSPPLPPLSWEALNEQKDFYDVQELVDPSPGLTNEKLKGRKEDDVVIFDYSLDPRYLRRGLTAEEGGPSSRSSSADDDLFLQVSKNRLMEPDQFDRIINSTREPLLTLPGGSRLDCGLLNPIGEKLGLQKEGETAFMDAHLQRVQALPGRKRFRTGISLRVPFNKPPESSRSGLPEDICTLFISVPYLGKYTGRIQLGPQSESVRLLDFKQLGAKVPYRRVEASEEEGDDIEKILVHQARYMIFDNNTMATFRSKEDSAKDQVPLHRFQERVGAFRAVIHMIANCIDLELWTLGKLQASLFKLEEDVRKGEQSRLQDLFTSLDRLSEALFSAIGVAERQIVVLQDIHNLFSAGCRAKVSESDQRYRSRQNPFHKTSAPIPILSENPEQIFPATLDTIDEVVFGLLGNVPEYGSSGVDHAAMMIASQGLQINAVVAMVAAFFVPFSACTSYYGMNIREFEEHSYSKSDFWMIAGPITSGPLLLTVAVDFCGDNYSI
ncbi:hypothetical protein HOY80DRAFT_1141619 [Tuber brumale]|nr:hypothetical protein HOY80DRAFT_1141619 [Tuber brumale]